MGGWGINRIKYIIEYNNTYKPSVLMEIYGRKGAF